MIDIHNHTLFGVDDGPNEIEESIRMLKSAEEQGITDIVLTPHYRKGMFSYPKELVVDHYDLLKKEAEKAGISTRLFLGCEYHADKDLLQNLVEERVFSMNASRYVLLEFSNGQTVPDMMDYVQSLVNAEYIPIVAHVERIEAIVKKPKICLALQEEGALIQCNADAVLGKEGFFSKRFTAKLLKNEWVDVIASDSHGVEKRGNHLQQAKEWIDDKFGESYGTYLFGESCYDMIAEHF